MKKKQIILILLIVYILIFGVNTTYSMYNSRRDSKVELSFAKIIFNNEELNNLSIPINNLVPGKEIVYKFKISNNKDGIRSEINIGYSIVVETFKIMPVQIELWNADGMVLVCDEENFSRNVENKLICDTEEKVLSYNEDKEDEYSLKISFSDKDNEDMLWNEEYADLIDFIDIKINSYQLVK